MPALRGNLHFIHAWALFSCMALERAVAAATSHGRHLRAAHFIEQSNQRALVEGEALAQRSTLAQRAKSAGKAKIPKPSGWFGDFSEGESSWTPDGVGSSNSNPEKPVMYGIDPSIPEPEVDDQKLQSPYFHESLSGADLNAWQTHFPQVDGSVAGGRHVTGNPWVYTPSGWVNEYVPTGDAYESPWSRVIGVKHANWFDNSVKQLDGYGRQNMPSSDSGRKFLTWEERSVNTTVTCNSPACTASASLQLFDGNTEEAKLCRLSISVHPTDYDDDFSREHVEYWKLNGAVATRQCNPRARGCNKTAETPLYPCLNTFPVDTLVDEMGTLVVEGKITRWVDECPHDGNLLSAVASATCMVRTKPNQTEPAVPSEVYTPSDLYGKGTLKCTTPGCKAETIVYFSPAIALNGGKCTLTVNATQTDYDDNVGLPEQIEFISVEGKNVTTQPVPAAKDGKNPCTADFKGTPLKDDEKIFQAVKEFDITELAKKSHPLGSLHITAKNSPQVDECGVDGTYLLYAKVLVDCKPPASFAAKPPAAGFLHVNDTGVQPLQPET